MGNEKYGSTEPYLREWRNGSVEPFRVLSFMGCLLERWCGVLVLSGFPPLFFPLVVREDGGFFGEELVRHVFTSRCLRVLVIAVVDGERKWPIALDEHKGGSWAVYVLEAVWLRLK